MAASDFAVHRFREIASTNDWLLAAARGGADDRSVVVADHQLRGRGRLDRTWEAPPGTSLLASVLVRAPLAPEDRHLVAVAMGLSALEGLQAVASLRAGLKWPNDLVVGDRKLGGILSEVDGSARTPAIVVGIGINLSWSGPAGANGTSVLEETGLGADRDALLDALLVGLDVHLGELGSAASRQAMLDAYRLRLTTIGRTVTVELPDETLRGAARGVTDHGLLVVAVDGALREVAAGDVVHVRPE